MAYMTILQDCYGYQTPEGQYDACTMNAQEHFECWAAPEKDNSPELWVEFDINERHVNFGSATAWKTVFGKHGRDHFYNYIRQLTYDLKQIGVPVQWSQDSKTLLFHGNNFWNFATTLAIYSLYRHAWERPEVIFGWYLFRQFEEAEKMHANNRLSLIYNIGATPKSLSLTRGWVNGTHCNAPRKSYYHVLDFKKYLLALKDSTREHWIYNGHGPQVTSWDMNLCSLFRIQVAHSDPIPAVSTGFIRSHDEGNIIKPRLCFNFSKREYFRYQLAMSAYEQRLKKKASPYNVIERIRQGTKNTAFMDVVNKMIEDQDNAEVA